MRQNPVGEPAATAAWNFVTPRTGWREVPRDRLAWLQRAGCVIRRLSAGRLRFGRLEALEIGDDFAGLGGRGEDGAIVVLQQFEPVRQVLRMIGPRVLGDGELGAEEGAGDFVGRDRTRSPQFSDRGTWPLPHNLFPHSYHRRRCSRLALAGTRLHRALSALPVNPDLRPLASDMRRCLGGSPPTPIPLHRLHKVSRCRRSSAAVG
jgi:hypothetical protein